MRANATRLPPLDRASAVCAAPPHLENGLVEDVAEGLCRDDADSAGDPSRDPDLALRPGPSLAGLALRPGHHPDDSRYAFAQRPPRARPAGWAAPFQRHPLAGSRVALRALQFDGSSVSMVWAVNMSSEPYVCDALFVYEQTVPAGPGGDHGEQGPRMHSSE